MTISRVRSKYLNGHLWKLFWSVTKQKFYAIFLEKKMEQLLTIKKCNKI